MGTTPNKLNLSALKKDKAEVIKSEEKTTVDSINSTKIDNGKGKNSKNSIESKDISKKETEENNEKTTANISDDIKTEDKPEKTVVKKSKISLGSIKTQIKPKKEETTEKTEVKDFDEAEVKKNIVELEKLEETLELGTIEKPSQQSNNTEIKDDKKEEDKPEIKIDDNLFENYNPDYEKKKKIKKIKEIKQEVTKSDAIPIESNKRVKGKLNKKKRNVIIIVILLCAMGVGSFALLPQLGLISRVKTNVIETQIEETKNNINNIIGTGSTSSGETNQETSIITEHKDKDNEAEKVEGNNSNKTEKIKLKNYLIKNYYK